MSLCENSTSLSVPLPIPLPIPYVPVNSTYHLLALFSDGRCREPLLERRLEDGRCREPLLERRLEDGRCREPLLERRPPPEERRFSIFIFSYRPMNPSFL